MLRLVVGRFVGLVELTGAKNVRYPSGPKPFLCYCLIPGFLYFHSMSQICQKCGKEYEPKRRGGKFCSTSCRVVQYQRGKQGKAWLVPPTGDEVYLAEKLAAVGRSAQEVLTKATGLPIKEELTALRELVWAWAGANNNSVIEGIQRREQQELAARAARFKLTR